MYKIFHKFDLVFEAGRGIKVYREDLLPFDLRHRDVDYESFLAWLSRRISNLQRTYMNKLYMQRRVGRSNEAIIADSAAMSPVDLFWITTERLSHTWDSLQVKRDESLAVKNVTLSGTIDPTEMFGVKSGQTSIFTTKGAFPKAIYKGFLIKKESNAEYEVSAFNIARHLGIKCAFAKAVHGEVLCELFTDEQVSLVHALELLYDFGEDSSIDLYEKALAKFKDRKDITEDLYRLYLLMYISSNNDFHGENFGFLYDTATFEITGVAPAYDFNSAFESWGNVLAYDPFILGMLPTIMQTNKDLEPKLRTISGAIKNYWYLRKVKCWQTVTSTVK